MLQRTAHFPTQTRSCKSATECKYC